MSAAEEDVLGKRPTAVATDEVLGKRPTAVATRGVTTKKAKRRTEDKPESHTKPESKASHTKPEGKSSHTNPEGKASHANPEGKANSCKRTQEEPHVICVRKAQLQQIGYRDLEHWLEYANHVYVGRNMTFYVKAAVGSKFRNPFNVKKFGRQGCIDKFREHLLASPELLADARRELRGCVLGCWCKPEACHADVLLQLVNQPVE